MCVCVCERERERERERESGGGVFEKGKYRGRFNLILQLLVLFV